MVLFFILPFSVCLRGNDIEKTMLENAGLKLEVRKEYMYKRETFFNYSMVTKIMYFTLAKQELNTVPNTEHLIKMFHLRIGLGGGEKSETQDFFFELPYAHVPDKLINSSSHFTELHSYHQVISTWTRKMIFTVHVVTKWNQLSELNYVKHHAQTMQSLKWMSYHCQRQLLSSKIQNQETRQSVRTTDTPKTIYIHCSWQVVLGTSEHDQFLVARLTLLCMLATQFT